MHFPIVISGTFPIDTTKTRLQVQGQKIDVRLTELKYRGMLHAALRISKEEGVCALYSGYVWTSLSLRLIVNCPLKMLLIHLFI